MSPYLIPLIGVPAVLAFLAAFQRCRLTRFLVILIATIIYAVLLCMHVDWAYAHPFNSSDGAARSFALLFGWAFGLIVVILPVYWITRCAKWIACHFSMCMPKNLSKNKNDE